MCVVTEYHYLSYQKQVTIDNSMKSWGSLVTSI